MQPGDPDRQRLGFQAKAATGTARAVVLIALEFLTHPIAVGLAKTPLHIWDDALEHPADLIDPAAFIIAKADLIVARTAQKHLLHAFRQVFPLGFSVEGIVFGNRVDGLQKVRAF